MTIRMGTRKQLPGLEVELLAKARMPKPRQCEGNFIFLQPDDPHVPQIQTLRMSLHAHNEIYRNSFYFEQSRR